MYATALVTLLGGSLAVSAKAIPQPLSGRDIEPRAWWSPAANRCWSHAIEGDNVPVDPSRCDADCPGNDKEKCGGVLALNLFYKGNYDIINGPATIEPEWHGYGNATCYA
ncbi:uncharacterized protein PG986_009600 [Apiospora aurea]|uniref:Uncharacterized protein n=1 Tax=Apiospora aurea TaxID=335848 RepID=A0ABR1Q861_9PEZI